LLSPSARGTLTTEQKRMTQPKPVSINKPPQPLPTNAISATLDPHR